MSGNEILVDTNILIYLLQKDDTLESLLDGKEIFISFITELELFGLPKMTTKQEKLVESLLNTCEIIQLTTAVKVQYKKIRKENKIKLADALVAATAMALDMPFMTADKEFATIKKLRLIQYDK